MTKYDPSIIEDQIIAVLRAWGLAPARAATTAAVMVDTDLAGIDSHGISMLPEYYRLIEKGLLNASAEPVIVHDTPTTALIDADNGLGHAVTVHAMHLASSKAAQQGIAAVAIRRSNHFGAAGYYARIAAELGQIGLVTSTTRTMAVVPTRATSPLLGTNPLAFSAPTQNSDEPFLLDMSTSTVAVNKVKVYEYRDTPLPQGWVLDGEGRSVTSPRDAYVQLRAQRAGGLSPLGGSEELSSYKGYGLAVMVQILAGVLSGSAFAPFRDPNGPGDIGHLCLVIDPGAFGDAATFRESVTQIVATLRAHTPISPDRPVQVAGDRERIVRTQRLADGIPVSEKLAGQIRGICSQTGAAFLL